MKPLLQLALTFLAVKASILDDDHDFMKGFETGVMMRSSESSASEFGCDEIKTSWDVQNRIDFYLKTISEVSAFLPSDSSFLQPFRLLTEYIEGLWQLIAVVDQRD